MFRAPSIRSGIQDPTLFGLILLCLCLSGFDATATVQHIVQGVAVELNPVMLYFMGISWLTFFFAKIFLTALGLWICYVKRRRWLGRMGIWASAGLYQILFFYHIFIFTTAYPHH